MNMPNQRVPRMVGRIVAVTLAVFAASVMPARACLAQPRSSSAPGRVIHLLVQTDPNMKAFEVGNKFITARDSTAGFSFVEHTVDPVDAESYLLVS
jgi:hypothetical protein